MNLAIFISGEGTNCENIIRYFADNAYINVSLVVSNKKDAYGLERAKALGIPTYIANKEVFSTPQQLLPLLRDIDFIVLAGFLLMIPDYLIDAYPKRIINLHPALLPKYGGRGMYGQHVHKAVKDAREKETGMTVHYVSNICDGGEIIAQIKTHISTNDSIEEIANKEHQLELEHFPKIIEEIILQNIEK